MVSALQGVVDRGRRGEEELGEEEVEEEVEEEDEVEEEEEEEEEGECFSVDSLEHGGQRKGHNGHIC